MDNDIKEHLDWIADRYQFMLAAYLNKTALIEDKIDELLAICFLGKSKNKWQFVNLILADISFGNKVSKLTKVLKELKPEIYKKMEKDNIADRLENLRKRRNLFAHSIINTNPNYLSKKRKDEIALLNPRDKQPHTPIKFKDFDEWNKDAKNILESLTDYIN